MAYNPSIATEAQYEAGIQRKIVENARNGFLKTYPRSGEVVYFLEEYYGNFDIIKSLQSTIRKYGKLTEKQYELACKMIDKQKEFVAKREQEKVAKNNALNELGFFAEEGSKFQIEVTFKRHSEFYVNAVYYGDSGRRNRYVFETSEGHQLVYMGGSYFDVVEGTKYIIKGSIKENQQYDGRNQSIIQRVKVLNIEDKS